MGRIESSTFRATRKTNGDGGGGQGTGAVLFGSDMAKYTLLLFDICLPS